MYRDFYSCVGGKHYIGCIESRECYTFDESGMSIGKGEISKLGRVRDVNVVSIIPCVGGLSTRCEVFIGGWKCEFSCAPVLALSRVRSIGGYFGGMFRVRWDSFTQYLMVFPVGKVSIGMLEKAIGCKVGNWVEVGK